MKPQHWLGVIAVVLTFLFVAFYKHKVCIDPDGTPHGPYSWLFPCKADQQSVTA